MKRTLNFTIILFMCMVAQGQDMTAHERDSLYTIWQDTGQPDSIRHRAMQEIIYDGMYSASPDSSLRLAHDLLFFARQRNLKLLEATALNLCGIFYNNKAAWDSAETYYLGALAIFEELNDKQRAAGCLNNLGNVVGYKGNMALSIEYLTRSLRIGEEEGDSSVVARALGNIGVCYNQQGDYDIALDFFQRRIKVAEAIGDKQCELEAWICIAIQADERHQPVAAREGFEKSLQLAREIDDVTSICVSLMGLGTIDVSEGKFERGRELLDSSLVIAVKNGDLLSESAALTVIARSHNLQGHKSEALQYARRALDKARQSGEVSVLRDAAEINYQVLKANGDAPAALVMHELFITMRDSIANDENKQAIMQQKFEYDYDKKEALLQVEQEKKDAIATEQIRRKNLQRNAFIGGFGLMLLLAGTFFFQRNRISKEKKRSEELLLNILPQEVAEELKSKGEADAKQIDQVTVLFTDFKGFTAMSEQLSAKELVRDIHECFSAFDHIMQKYGIEKIKTIGDAYMAAGGLPTPNETHALDVVKAAFEIQEFIAQGKARKLALGLPFFEIRIGIHTGPVVAGIVGVKKFAYDIWGDTVNTASRMESSGEVGQVNISETTYALVKDEPGLSFTSRGKVQAKGKGMMEMYFVVKR